MIDVGHAIAHSLQQLCQVRIRLLKLLDETVDIAQTHFCLADKLMRVSSERLRTGVRTNSLTWVGRRPGKATARARTLTQLHLKNKSSASAHRSVGQSHPCFGTEIVLWHLDDTQLLPVRRILSWSIPTFLCSERPIPRTLRRLSPFRPGFRALGLSRRVAASLPLSLLR